MLLPDYTPLEVLLAKNKQGRKILREDLKISPQTIAKFAKSEFVSMDVLARICDHFDCQIQDVVQFVRVSEEEDEA